MKLIQNGNIITGDVKTINKDTFIIIENGKIFEVSSENFIYEPLEDGEGIRKPHTNLNINIVVRLGVN